MDAAQSAYENEISAATGNDIPHNDWALKLSNPADTDTETPPTNLLKEGVATKFKGKGTWTLENGKPTQVSADQATPAADDKGMVPIMKPDGKGGFVNGKIPKKDLAAALAAGGKQP